LKLDAERLQASWAGLRGLRYWLAPVDDAPLYGVSPEVWARLVDARDAGALTLAEAVKEVALKDDSESEVTRELGKLFADVHDKLCSSLQQLAPDPDRCLHSKRPARHGNPERTAQTSSAFRSGSWGTKPTTCDVVTAPGGTRNILARWGQVWLTNRNGEVDGQHRDIRGSAPVCCWPDSETRVAFQFAGRPNERGYGS